MRAQAGRPWAPRTTDSNHPEPIAPNRLVERPAPEGPNQVWPQDITYVPAQEGWLYLALVLDLWSRRVVGWAMADHWRSELVVSALVRSISLTGSIRRAFSSLLYGVWWL